MTMDPGYLLPLQAGAPAADPSLRQQLRRLALKRYGLGEDDSADPVRAIETPGGTGLYHTSQIADASVDHSPETNWKRRKTQAIIDAAIAGLGGLDPRSGGLSGFLGSAAQAAGRVRGAFDARMAEQEPQGPPIPAEMLKYAFGEDRQPTEFEQYQADPQGYARFKQAGLKPEAPPKPQLVRSSTNTYVPVDPVTGMGPDGKPVHGYVPPKEGSTGKVQDEKLKFGIAGGIEAIDGALALLEKDPQANVTPVGSKWAESASHLPYVGGVFGGLAESASQQAMSPNQQAYSNYMESLAHNVAGLLPNKGLAIFKSLRDVYKSQAGSSPEARAAKVQLLIRLRRRLVQLQNGEPVTEDDIANEINGVSASTGQGPLVPSVPRPQNTTSPTVNPADWFRPRSTP